MNNLFSSLHVWSSNLLNSTQDTISTDPVYQTSAANEVLVLKDVRNDNRVSLYDAVITNAGSDAFSFSPNGEDAVISLGAGESFDFKKNLLSVVKVLTSGAKIKITGFYD